MKNSWSAILSACVLVVSAAAHAEEYKVFWVSAKDDKIICPAVANSTCSLPDTTAFANALAADGWEIISVVLNGTHYDVWAKRNGTPQH